MATFPRPSLARRPLAPMVPRATNAAQTPRISENSQSEAVSRQEQMRQQTKEQLMLPKQQEQSVWRTWCLWWGGVEIGEYDSCRSSDNVSVLCYGWIAFGAGMCSLLESVMMLADRFFSNAGRSLIR